MAKVVNGSKVICTIDVADIRRAYSQMSLSKLKACYVPVFYREKAILNPEGQKEIIQFFPTCLPCSASIILPIENLCRFLFNEVISEHLSVYATPYWWLKR